MAFLNRRPIPLPTQLADATAAGYTFHLSGELVPVLTVELAPGQSIFFEHHILLWKEPAVQISVRPLAGMLKRMIAGMQILITEARGPGQIAVSRDGVGQIFPIVLGPGQELHVREHQFLAGTSTIDYTWERVSGIANMLFGGTGFFIDRFHATSGEGIVWLHGHGNVFEKDLAPGEQIDVEPGGWLYKDPSVQLETNLTGLSTGFLAGKQHHAQSLYRSRPARTAIRLAPADERRSRCARPVRYQHCRQCRERRLRRAGRACGRPVRRRSGQRPVTRPFGGLARSDATPIFPDKRGFPLPSPCRTRRFRWARCSN